MAKIIESSNIDIVDFNKRMILFLPLMSDYQDRSGYGQHGSVNFLDNDLISQYKLNGNLLDSKSANHLSMNGSLNYAEGKFGQSIYQDGLSVNNYLKANSASNLNPNSVSLLARVFIKKNFQGTQTKQAEDGDVQHDVGILSGAYWKGRVGVDPVGIMVRYTIPNTSYGSMVFGVTGYLSSANSQAIRGVVTDAVTGDVLSTGYNTDSPLTNGQMLWRTMQAQGNDLIVTIEFRNLVDVYVNSFYLFGGRDGVVGKSGQYDMIISDGQIRFNVNNGTTNANAQGGAVIPVNQWAAIAATYDGTTAYTYLNGAQTASTSFSGSLAQTTNQLLVGKGNIFSCIGYMNIDDVRVYGSGIRQKSVIDYSFALDEWSADNIPGFLSEWCYFDGLGKYIQRANFNMPSNNQMAFSFFHKTDLSVANLKNYHTIFSDARQQQGTAVGFIWLMVGQSGDILFNYADQVAGQYGSYCTWSSVVTDNLPHHYVINIDWQNKKAWLYKDGVLQGTEKTLHANTLTPTFNTRTVYIGAYSSSHWAKLNGYLKQFGLFDKLLSLSEISSLYNQGNGNLRYNLTTLQLPFNIAASQPKYSADCKDSFLAEASTIKPNVIASQSDYNAQVS